MDPQLIASFTVPGRPVPKARPRVSQDRRGRNRTHTDARTVEHEALVARCFLEATRRRFVDPTWRYRLDLEFYGAHASADGDNLLKCFQDALNFYAYKDDKQVREVHYRMIDAVKAEARTEASIYRIA